MTVYSLYACNMHICLYINVILILCVVSLIGDYILLILPLYLTRTLLELWNNFISLVSDYVQLCHAPQTIISTPHIHLMSDGSICLPGSHIDIDKKLLK